MPLTKRQVALLEILFDQEIYTSEQLAKQLQISNRTLRYEIQAINEYYPNLIVSIKGKGYQFNVEQEHANTLLASARKNVEGNTEYLYIIKRLVSSPNIDFYALADEMYISESTLEKQIQAVNAIIARRNAHIHVERKNNQLSLCGSEEEHRQIYTYFMNHEMDQYNFDLSRYTDFFMTCDLQEVKAFVLEFQRLHHIEMRDFELISLILHIAIMLERITKGCEIETIAKTQFDEEAIQLAKSFAIGLKERFDVSLSEMELQYLTALFAGKINNTSSQLVQQIKELIATIIDHLHQNYDLDFHQDEVFQENLLIHLLGLEGRIRTASYLNNPLIKDIRVHFPLLYDMSVYVAMIVSDYFHAQLIEDEIGYITLHIMSAVERIVHVEHKSILLINPFGDAAAAYLQEKLNKVQDPKITITKTMSLFDCAEIAANHPDLVISFLPVNEQIATPVYVLNRFPKESDIQKIISLLSTEKETLDACCFFHEELFFPNCAFTNKEEIIHFLCDQLMQKGYCDASFEDDVIAREQMAPTAYGASFALPHPIKKSAKQNAVALCILKQAIPWNNRSVKLIFLLCLSAKKDPAFDSLFEQLVSLLDEPQKVKRLLKKNDLDSFLVELKS